jgi:hypothetical protein
LRLLSLYGEGFYEEIYLLYNFEKCTVSSPSMDNNPATGTPLLPLPPTIPHPRPQSSKAQWSSISETKEDLEMAHPAPPAEKTPETFQERKSAAWPLYGASAFCLSEPAYIPSAQMDARTLKWSALDARLLKWNCLPTAADGMYIFK